MKERIEQEVIAMVSRQLGISDQAITPNQHLFDDLGADSLDAIELVMEAEEVFEIEISDDDAEKVKTVQDAIDLAFRLS